MVFRAKDTLLGHLVRRFVVKVVDRICNGSREEGLEQEAGNLRSVGEGEEMR